MMKNQIETLPNGGLSYFIFEQVFVVKYSLLVGSCPYLVL